MARAVSGPMPPDGRMTSCPATSALISVLFPTPEAPRQHAASSSDARLSILTSLPRSSSNSATFSGSCCSRNGLALSSYQYFRRATSWVIIRLSLSIDLVRLGGARPHREAPGHHDLGLSPKLP